MTSSISPSDNPRHESFAWFDAETHAGVRYGIARMSLGRRIELARQIREIGTEAGVSGGGRRRAGEAGSRGARRAKIDRAYLEWGLEAVEGLEIDGEAATPESLIEKGPMELAAEILGRIRSECGLSESERKN